MEKRIKIYLDTSVISFLFADDAPDKRDVTREFFRDFILPGRYETYISEFVTAEIENTRDIVRMNKMLSAIEEYALELLPVSDLAELDDLAEKYISEGIIPLKKSLDAYHIAITVSNEIPILVSWNFKHLANVNRERRVNAVNLANNYYNEVRIITPLQLMDYGN